MHASLNLLLVDDDFEKYETHIAIGLVIRRLREEHLNMYYTLCQQKDTLDAVTNEHVDALLIDNDFGEGIKTLKKLQPYLAERGNPTSHKLPVAYVSAYDMAGLMNQHSRLSDPNSPSRAPRTLSASFLPEQSIEDELVHPSRFHELGITLIQKRGNNVAKDLPLPKLAEDIYQFVRPLYR